MARPHRRYSSPGRGIQTYLLPETPQRFEMCVSNVLGFGIPNVGRGDVVGFMPAVNGGILSSKKDRRANAGVRVRTLE